MSGREAFRASYTALLDLLPSIDDETGWRPTGCAGWAVRDLLFHLLCDAQRALVALHAAADGPPDADAVSYWSPWQPGTPGADAGRRGIRISASAWSSVAQIGELYAETIRAVRVGSREGSLVRTGGLRMVTSRTAATRRIGLAFGPFRAC
jgi:mycothiol maleylpyruvate isomerase-like protein